MNKFIPQNFNDFLALVLITLIPAFWVLQGRGLITEVEGVNSGLLVTWALIVQFYFRKKSDE